MCRYISWCQLLIVALPPSLCRGQFSQLWFAAKQPLISFCFTASRHLLPARRLCAALIQFRVYSLIVSTLVVNHLFNKHKPI